MMIVTRNFVYFTMVKTQKSMYKELSHSDTTTTEEVVTTNFRSSKNCYIEQ